MESGEMDLLSKKAILSLPRDVEKSLDGKILDEYINVKDIEALPTVQSQSNAGQLNDSAQSTNLIDRQAAIDGKIIIQRTNGVEIYYDEAVPVGYLKRLPSAQPERKKGEWIEISSINHTYKCSECGRLLVNVADGRNNVSKHYPYCHCGADMRGEKDERTD